MSSNHYPIKVNYKFHWNIAGLISGCYLFVFSFCCLLFFPVKRDANKAVHEFAKYSVPLDLDFHCNAASLPLYVVFPSFLQ